MKKPIVLILLLFVLVLGVGCSNNKNIKTETKEATETSSEGGIDVKKNILTAEVTLPTSLVVKEGETVEEFLEDAKNNREIIDAKKNENDTITLLITKSKHEKMINATKSSIEESIDDLIKDDGNSIVDIKHSDDYSHFEVYVDPNKYTAFESMNALIFYFEAAMYRALNGNADIYTLVDFINYETDEVIETGDSKALFG